MSILDDIIARGGEPTALELRCVITLEDQQRVTTLDPDTFARNYPELVVALSPKRRGTTLGSALAVARGEARNTAA